MNVLILNCGSSSIGFAVYAAEGSTTTDAVHGKARNVATKTQQGSYVQWRTPSGEGRRDADLSTHARATGVILDVLKDAGVEIDAVGHRFVHGGTAFAGTTLIDDTTLPALRETTRLAPIHNPNSLSAIDVCRQRLGATPQYAVFDTAFHAAMPAESATYALPADLRAAGLRKYGFHGLSYQYVSRRVAELLERPLAELRLIICHLGTGGSSVVAVRDGVSLDTSMGYSPLPGLVMSTRCGDLDPSIVLQLIRDGADVDAVEKVLNSTSGLVGLSGVTSNLIEVIAGAEKGDDACRLAYDVYAARLAQYIGGYFWRLGGADALVFTDDAGMNAWQLRERLCSGVEALGVSIDAAANRSAVGGVEAAVHAAASGTKILVVPTDEEQVILDEVLARITQ